MSRQRRRRRSAPPFWSRPSRCPAARVWPWAAGSSAVVEDIGGLVHTTALAARLGPDLLKGLPETECAVGHREFRPDRQPPPPEVEQQLPPGLHALAHAIGQAHDLLLAFRRRADDDQKALGVRFKAGLHMDAVNPEVDVAFGREIALRPPGMLVRPGLLEAGDARGG